ncbi:hypothetical protein CLCAR_1101 [Clostridium carboxidivorans P7]|nr:hypothetical protein CLCAR_1101 [Clostridium carboxidivorans P7]
MIVFPTVAANANDVIIVVGIDFFIKPTVIERIPRAPTVKAINKMLCKVPKKQNGVNMSLTIGHINSVILKINKQATLLNISAITVNKVTTHTLARKILAATYRIGE